MLLRNFVEVQVENVEIETIFCVLFGSHVIRLNCINNGPLRVTS